MNKLIFKTKALCTALSTAKACISGNNVVPVLKCFRLRYFKEDNTCEVISYNQLNEMRLIIPVEQSNCEDGTMLAIEAEKLVGVLKTINSEEITINFNDRKATFKHPEGQLSFNLEDPNDYPVMSIKPGEMIRFKVNKEKFHSSMRKAISFMEVSKGIDTSLCGLNVEIKKEKIYVCASDGCKLFYDEISATENNMDPLATQPILINQISIKEAVSLISLMDGEEIQLSVSEDGRCFSINDMNGYYAFNCALMELRPLKFKMVVNNVIETNPCQIQVNAYDLKTALDRIRVMSDTLNNTVCLSGVDGEDVINISFTNDSDNSEANEVIRLSKPISGVLSCRLNIVYFSLCVKAINDSILTINYEADNKTKPILLANQENDKSTLCLVMPWGRG